MRNQVHVIPPPVPGIVLFNDYHHLIHWIIHESLWTTRLWRLSPAGLAIFCLRLSSHRAIITAFNPPRLSADCFSACLARCHASVILHLPISRGYVQLSLPLITLHEPLISPVHLIPSARLSRQPFPPTLASSIAFYLSKSSISTFFCCSTPSPDWPLAPSLKPSLSSSSAEFPLITIVLAMN